jgi:hypothetical protein
MVGQNNKGLVLHPPLINASCNKHKGKHKRGGGK